MGKAGFRFGGGGGSEGLPLHFAYTDPSPSKPCWDPSSSGSSPPLPQPLVFSSLRDPQGQLQSFHLVPWLSPFSLAENLGDKGASIQGSCLSVESDCFLYHPHHVVCTADRRETVDAPLCPPGPGACRVDRE